MSRVEWWVAGRYLRSRRASRFVSLITLIAISGVTLEGRTPGGALELRSAWTCHVYDVKRATQHVFFGRYEHRLRSESGNWRIAAKTIVLMNDRIPTMIDFYCV